MDLSGFDANTIEPAQTFEPLPNGDYKVAITETENRPTKAGTGSYLLLKLQVLEGDHQGRILFDRLNLDNPNQTAVDIAKRTLSAICTSVGVMTPKDSSELMDKPMMVKVVVTPPQNGYDAGNDIKGYKPAGAASNPPTGAAKKPWE